MACTVHYGLPVVSRARGRAVLATGAHPGPDAAFHFSVVVIENLVGAKQCLRHRNFVARHGSRYMTLPWQDIGLAPPSRHPRLGNRGWKCTRWLGCRTRHIGVPGTGRYLNAPPFLGVVSTALSVKLLLLILGLEQQFGKLPVAGYLHKDRLPSRRS